MESKHYYIDLIDSTVACRFTAYYHYTGIAFKHFKFNQGIFRKDNDKLVGVLQWGVSASNDIRLNKYVKEPIEKENYLELNRFCMDDNEGKNAESEAISLGIKWIKVNRPEVRLLVSYSGRKEGNYGYIYQATNWEYLGYFVSGFYELNGLERHSSSAWFYCQRNGDPDKSLRENLKSLFSNVKRLWSKQFIYIQRLDKSLTPAVEPMIYPKPSNEYPITTRIEVITEGDYEVQQRTTEKPNYYYKDTKIVPRKVSSPKSSYAIYDLNGTLEEWFDTQKEVCDYCGISMPTVGRSIKTSKATNGYFIREFRETPLPEIDVDYICEIDGVKFLKQIDIASYCGVSRQAVSGSVKRKSPVINGYEVVWNEKLV